MLTKENFNASAGSAPKARYSLEPNKVKGKIVYCKFRTWSTEAIVKAIGGIGTVVFF
jgi:hypothetical protein